MASKGKNFFPVERYEDFRALRGSNEISPREWPQLEAFSRKHRNIYCEWYDYCLSEAAQKFWKGFTCSSCSHSKNERNKGEVWELDKNAPSCKWPRESMRRAPGKRGKDKRPRAPYLCRRHCVYQNMEDRYWYFLGRGLAVTFGPFAAKLDAQQEMHNYRIRMAYKKKKREGQ